MILATTMAACSGDDDDVAPTTSVSSVSTTTAPARPDDGQLSVGVFLPTTGPGAPLGGPMIEAVRAAADAIDEAGGVLGRDIELTVADEGAGTGLDELLGLGVDAIVGPASSLVALSQLGAAVQTSTGVVTCSPSATALALDSFPDNQLFFRTVPSDSLQMAAIARRAQNTGLDSIAIGYLDDPYGRGLAGALLQEAARRRLTITAEVPFSGDQEDLSAEADALLVDDPGVVVVLGDSDDGGRLLTALDAATVTGVPNRVIINDALRSARQTIQGLSDEFRTVLEGVAPLAESTVEGAPEGAFAGHAADCLNLIALAAEQAGSDSPQRISANMAAVSVGGRACATFADCAVLVDNELQIDYNGFSGFVDLSSSTGDPTRATFEAFSFGDDGVENAETTTRFEAP